MVILCTKHGGAFYSPVLIPVLFYFFLACECKKTATVTTPEPSMKGRDNSNPKSGIEMRVVRSIATEVE